MSYDGRWQTVRVSLEEGIAWVELNRPEKKNAMNPLLNAEMIEVLEVLDADEHAGVLVLTGAGDSFSAGMDLKEYFREVDGKPAHVQRKVRRDNGDWQIRMLRNYAKPTIAMVNGWCFGGAFIPLVACDLAVAADEATFGLSEINWGIPPGSIVSRVRAEVEQLARELLAKSPVALAAAKVGFRNCRGMDWELAEDYLYAKLEQSQFLDGEGGREEGLKQFLDEKRIRPGLQSYHR